MTERGRDNDRHRDHKTMNQHTILATRLGELTVVRNAE
jgi:hypothetical protein